MEVALTEVDSSTSGRKIVLDKLPALIGQSPDAAICLEDQWVSRHHCQIDAVKGTLVVRDLGSMLGTFVNGLNVTTALLMPGDRLTVGGTSFLVDYERASLREAPARAAAQPLGAQVVEPAPTKADRRGSRLIFFRLPRRLLPFLRKRNARE